MLSFLQGGWLDRKRDVAILAKLKLNDQTELLGNLIAAGEKRYSLYLLQDLLEEVPQPPHRLLLELYSKLHSEITGEPETLEPETEKTPTAGYARRCTDGQHFLDK